MLSLQGVSELSLLHVYSMLSLQDVYVIPTECLYYPIECLCYPYRVSMLSLQGAYVISTRFLCYPYRVSMLSLQGVYVIPTEFRCYLYSCLCYPYRVSMLPLQGAYVISTRYLCYPYRVSQHLEQGDFFLWSQEEYNIEYNPKIAAFLKAPANDFSGISRQCGPITYPQM